MKNFIVILFVFFIFLLIASLYANDLTWIFLTIFTALLITIICVANYSGFWRGISLIVLMIVLPFIFEYLLSFTDYSLFAEPIIKKLSLSQFNLPINRGNLFYIFTTPLLFMSGLIFSQKIKHYFSVKKYHKTFLIICSALLLSLNNLLFADNVFSYQLAIKWLLISLIVYTLLSRLYIFKVDTDELYKEMPIILYLAIYGANALRGLNSFNLLITVILIAFYLFILYNEYKIRKLSQTV